jgi:hypothetical protein
MRGCTIGSFSGRAHLRKQVSEGKLAEMILILQLLNLYLNTIYAWACQVELKNSFAEKRD